jgi:hypothetical protein
MPLTHQGIGAYNLSVMRQWLLAVFVLQMFWNMAGFAVLGQLHASAVADPLSVAVSVVDAQRHDGKGLTDQAHGLLDELPDLPDTLLRQAPIKTVAGLAPAYMGWVEVGTTDPWPETLFRPPQRG